MKLRTSALMVFGMAVALSAAVAAAAPAAEDKTHEGTIVSFENNQLTMTDKDGQNRHTHDIAETVQITIDGNPGQRSNLKAGMTVRVTTDAEGKVTRLAAMSAKPPQ